MKLFRHLRPLKKSDKPKLLDPHSILTADALLNTTSCKEFVKAIKLIIKPTHRFNHFYLPVIKKFAEFVQNITETQHGFFNREISFLGHGLERSARTLALVLKHFFPKEESFVTISDKDALWIYAVFTAALFLDIGKLAVKYSVMIYHKKGYLIKKWNPYRGSMLGQGSSYKFDYIKENLNDLRYFVTPILARQILDSLAVSPVETNGFNWIASDPVILQSWFSLLSGEDDRIPMTSFMSMIPRADIDIIENYRLNAQITLENPAGEAFLQWLRKELSKERMTINEGNSKIQIMEGKIVLSTTLFQDFIHENPNFKHPAIVEKQFIDVAKVYQIPISELYQRSRAIGGISGQNDPGKRYRALGGFSVIHENEKNLQQRVLQGDIRLISFIMPYSAVCKTISADITTKNRANIFISPTINS